MGLVLEGNCDGRGFELTFHWLGLSHARSLVEVEGWDVDAVSGFESVLVEVIDVLG